MTHFLRPMITLLSFAKCAPIAALLLFVTTMPAHSQTPGGRARLSLDFDWKFTLGDPRDALKSSARVVSAGASADQSGDTGAGTAQLASKSGDAAMQIGSNSIFYYPEPGVLDKTKLADRKARAELDATRSDPVAKNLGGGVSYVRPEFNDAKWQAIDLPHDWVVGLPFGRGDGAAANIAHGRKAVDSKTGTNIGWYRRTFDLPASDKGQTLWLEFDGVYRNSLVWLNGHCLGRFTSGYTSFTCDISRLANYGGKNTLVVRADATRGEGWFYEGGGIYRHVWLVKTAPIHVAHWGTDLTTEMHGSDGKVTIRTTVANDSATPAIIQLETTIFDASGKMVAVAQGGNVNVAAKKETEVTQTLTVPVAHLWSPETPYLYRAVSAVKVGGGIADRYETPFGIRTIEFTADQGMLLNGQPYKIKGTANHQDHAGVGSALPDRIQEFRIKRLKELGSNAYRCAHNPPAPELLDACDRLGMLVLDENRRFDDTPEVLGQLGSLIRRDRNHPSVFMWSLANEEMDLQKSEKEGVEIARAMQKLANQLDPTRLTTIANNGAWKGWRQGFNNIVQVAGVNYFHHEEKNLDQYHADFPTRLLLGTEESSTIMTRGEYAKDEKRGTMPAYDTDFPKWGTSAETWWSFYAARPWLPGGFAWTGFDYRGEPTPYNFAYSSQFGIMDTCGFPKDAFYYYQSWWSDQPVLHIFPHWNWSGKEGQKINVWAFSNADEVELLLNGKSLGRQKMPLNSHLEWPVAYEPGVLSAKGYRHGKVIAETKVETTGKPAAIQLTPDRTTIRADGQDVSMVTVAVVDDKGRVVPTADNMIDFKLAGAGKILGVGNGHPNTTESDQQPRRHVFNGLAQVIVQSGRKPAPLTLTATSPGLSQATTTLQTTPAGPQTTLP